MFHAYGVVTHLEGEAADEEAVSCDFFAVIPSPVPSPTAANRHNARMIIVQTSFLGFLCFEFSCVVEVALWEALSSGIRGS